MYWEIPPPRPKRFPKGGDLHPDAQEIARGRIVTLWLGELCLFSVSQTEMQIQSLDATFTWSGRIKISVMAVGCIFIINAMFHQRSLLLNLRSSSDKTGMLEKAQCQGGWGEVRHIWYFQQFSNFGWQLFPHLSLCNIHIKCCYVQGWGAQCPTASLCLGTRMPPTPT